MIPDRKRNDARWRRRSGRWLALAAATFIGSGFVGLHDQSGQTPIRPAQFVKSIERNRDTYYRLKVKLTYWGTPQDFDIVVGCNVRQINYRGGGNTYEVGLVPTVFGRRMYDGKGLVIRPPNACRGETTANGRVQPDLLPLVIVYDDAKTLDFGIAYVSQDAYDNPLSVLRFGGATIEKATRAEFDQFRHQQVNLVTREIFWTGAAGADALKSMGLKPAKEPFARTCEGYERFRIPEEARTTASKPWPEARPRYWITDTYEAERAIDVAIRNSPHVQTDRNDVPPRLFRQFDSIGDESADFGFWTRTGGGRVSSSRGYGRPASYYPAASDFRADRWPLTREDWPSYIDSQKSFAEEDVDFRRGMTRGFAYCYARILPWVDNGSRRPKVDQNILNHLTNKRVLARVDGQLVATARPDFYTPIWIFERDEYAFHFFRIFLGTPRGDV